VTTQMNAPEGDKGKSMTSPDKAIEVLLELGNPAERWTRAELLDRALRTALTLTDSDAVVILRTSRGREERLALHSGSSLLAVFQPPPQGSEVLRSLVQRRHPLLVPDLSEDMRIVATDGCPGVEAGPAMFLPLRQHNLAPAYISAYRRRGRARFTMHDVRSMLLLGAWFSAETEALHLSTSREKLVVTDDLADVYNFRFLKSALGRETRRAQRFGHELSVVKIAVDPLAHSRLEGEGFGPGSLFAELASVLAPLVRSFDILAKGGSDQLVLLLPETGREGAVEVAERARAAVESRAFSPAEPGVVTVSLGVASFPADAADAKGLLAAADQALHNAREHGRNRVATPARRAA
jgi:diguanylate cyclase (GGDEF)-like protein